MDSNGDNKEASMEVENLSKIICLDEFEKLARKKLPAAKFKFLFHGADEEITCKFNHQMIVDGFYLRPRILRDVRQIDTSKWLFGHKFSMPIGVAPTGMQKMFEHKGEMSTALAVAKQQTLMVLSQFSTTSQGDIALKMGPDFVRWQNIYMFKDLEHTMEIITGAIKNGFSAIVITCDAPIFGHRRESTLDQPDFSNYDMPILNSKDGKIKDNMKNHANSIFDESRTWSDVAYIKKRFGNEIKIILKGVMTVEDSMLALNMGIDAIYVSNHGGRQLDSCSSTIEALTLIAKVIRGRIPILVDGGFRTGSDVMKALALGADMVLLGRPILYSLSVAGESGVEHALKLIRSELKRCMQLCGTICLEDINTRVVAKRW